MAIDAFMYFEPFSVKTSKRTVEVKGESLDSIGKGKFSFEIVSFDWGASSSAKGEGGGSSSTKLESSFIKENGLNPAQVEAIQGKLSQFARSSGGKTSAQREVNVGSFKISKTFDTASCGLFAACIDVECEFEKATVGFRKHQEKEPFVYAMFVFEHVRVDSVDWDFSSDSNQEKIEFSCDKCVISYFPQSKTGEKDKPAKKTAFYDRSTSTSGSTT